MARAQLTAEQAEEVLRTPPSAYTMTLLRDWLAIHRDRPARLDAQAALVIPPDLRRPPPAAEQAAGEWTVRWAPNWARIAETTVGRYMASNLVFSRSRALRAAFDFVDAPWDKKVIGGIEQRLVDLRLLGTIDADDADWVINRLQWLGFAPTAFLAPSMTIDTIRLPPAVRKMKEGLVAGELGRRARAGDLAAMGAIEGQLLDAAKEALTGVDPGMDIYTSGAKGQFSNNYKMSAVARGAIFDPADASKYHISTASLEEGIPAEELPNYANILVSASYGRALNTAKGGYIAKQLNAAFQSVRLDPDPASDCRTGRLLRVTLDSPRDFLFRFYREGSRLDEILPNALDTLRGDSVMMRSPLYCELPDCICSRCAGTMYYRMGIMQIGLLTSRIGTTMLNSALKAFHDSSVKLSQLTLGKYSHELPTGDAGHLPL